MRVVSAFILAGLLAGGVARAEILRPATKCSEIVSIMDGDNRQKIGYAVQFIADAMSAADENPKTHKRSGTFDGWSDDGLTSMIAMSIARCRSGRYATAKDAAISVMEGVRAFGGALGATR